MGSHITQQQPCHKGSLQRKVPCWPTNWGPAITLILVQQPILLFPSRRAEASTLLFVTHNTPGGAHTWKENIYCFLLRTAFPASHSSTSSRHRRQTACQQEYSTTQEHGNPLWTQTLATWAGSWGK